MVSVNLPSDSLIYEIISFGIDFFQISPQINFISASESSAV